MEQVSEDYGGNKRQKANWDNGSFRTSNLYNAPPSARTKDQENEMQPIAETNDNDNEAADTNTQISEEEGNGYTIVGTGGKVRWEFFLTATTMNAEIKQTAKSKLLHAVQRVENQLGVKFQYNGISLGPKEQAKRARDVLLRKKQKPKKGVPFAGTTGLLTRNVALEDDDTMNQSPGLKVTGEEQTLANEGLLEYSFHSN